MPAGVATMHGRSLLHTAASSAVVKHMAASASYQLFQLLCIEQPGHMTAEVSHCDPSIWIVRLVQSMLAFQFVQQSSTAERAAGSAVHYTRLSVCVQPCLQQPIIYNCCVWNIQAQFVSCDLLKHSKQKRLKTCTSFLCSGST